MVEDSTWISNVNRVITLLGTDLANHRKLADAWTRKAQSMVKTWSHILRSGRTARGRARRVAEAWRGAAPAMASSLNQRAYQQRMRTGWKRWATDRAQEADRWPGKFQIQSLVDHTRRDGARRASAMAVSTPKPSSNCSNASSDDAP